MGRGPPAPRGFRGTLTAGPCRTDHQLTAGTSRHFPYEQRTELRCPPGGSVPLARPLSPSSLSPFGSQDRRQVLRELRVVLCQRLTAAPRDFSKITGFCPVSPGLSTKKFVASRALHRFLPSFTQIRAARQRPTKRFRDVLRDRSGRAGRHAVDFSIHRPCG